MKKEYVNPELRVVRVHTAALLNESLPFKEGTAGAGSSVAPGYDLEDDEDWGDEEETADGRHGAY